MNFEQENKKNEFEKYLFCKDLATHNFINI